MNYQEIVFQIILHGGNAKSSAMEAIALAKKGDIEGARGLLKDAGQELSKAHKIQTQLIQNEAKGEKTEVSLLLIHAQDHLMNAITIKDMAYEFVDLYTALGSREIMTA
ncbi:MAG: PTS lactose/cellobiose transporter subunit IIA [Bacillota bacterium]